MMDTVVKAVTVVQSNTLALEYVTLGAKLIEHYILHGDDDNVSKVVDSVK